jgi:tetratricopeptide (TPR) repeat protein
MSDGTEPKPAATPVAAQNFRSAVLLHRQGRLREAEQLYRSVLKVNESDFDCLHNLGLLQAQQGKFEEAARLIGAAARQNSRSVEAHNNLGNVLALLNRHEEAIECYRRVVALKADYAEAHNNLGIALAALGRRQEAIAHYRKALAVNPSFSKAHNNLATVLDALGQHAEAIACYEQALALAPSDPEIHNNMGVALAALDRVDEAISRYTRALALRPSYAEAHNNLAAALETLGRLDEAIKHCERAIELKADFPEARNNLGNVLKGLNRYAEALASYQKALGLRPSYAQARSNMGDALRELGRAEEARREYQMAVQLAPDRPPFYRRLVETKHITADDPDLAALKRLAQADSLSVDDRIELEFALAKALGDLGQNEQAFRHLLEGNALKRRTIAYDEASVLGSFTRIRAAFTPELMGSRRGLGNPSPLPVFILGMIRSGTTLVEQILASHSKVHGAGERLDFAGLVERIRPSDGSAAGFPESFAAIAGEQLKQLAAQYLDRIRPAAPAAERITDKMPANFRFVGAIQLALPNARIIHVRRDPADTCLSCFSILFTGDQPFAYDLGELGRYYRAYEALMQHWRAVLPEGVMLEIKYEELIADTEAQARRMVAHCGLEWESNCLDFYQTQRPVRTASALQVRRPTYRTSVGRWQPYQAQLGPLLEALNLAPAPSSEGRPEA